MSEKTTQFDRLDTAVGAISLNLESIEGLTSELLSRPLEPRVLSVEEFSELSSVGYSAIEHKFNIESGETEVYAEIPIDHINEYERSRDDVMTLLFNYFVVEAEFEESNVERTYYDEIELLDLHTPSGVRVSIDYAQVEPILTLSAEFFNDGTEDSVVNEKIVEVLQIWAHLHDFGLWMCDADKTSLTHNRLTIHAEYQSDLAFTVWQSLLDYELWAEGTDTPGLPGVEYEAMDFNQLSIDASRTAERSRAELFLAIRSLAVSLRGREDHANLTPADIRAAIFA